MGGILLKLSRGNTLSRSRFPGKRYNWTQIHFVTHLIHQGHAWRRIDPEMADLEDFWVCWKHTKNLVQPKKRRKIKATPFLDVFEVSGSESEVRISIKILVLKLSNLMTLIVCNCRQHGPWIEHKVSLLTLHHFPAQPQKEGWYWRATGIVSIVFHGNTGCRPQ